MTMQEAMRQRHTVRRYTDSPIPKGNGGVAEQKDP